LRAGLSRFASPRLDFRAFRPTESPETIWTLAARRHVREELKVSGRKLKGSRCAASSVTRGRECLRCTVYFLKRFSNAVRASMGRAELGVEVSFSTRTRME